MVFRHNASLKMWGMFIFALVNIFTCENKSLALAAEPVQAPLPSLFDTRERIAKPDLSNVLRIRFLTTLDFPPLNFLDQSGKLAGFQVDLVREICNELELAARCQIEALPYDELQQSLASGRGEAIIAGVRPTFELRRDFVFSRPFMQLPARFLLNMSSNATVKSASDLEGKDVGVVANTVHQAMLAAYFPAIKQKSYPDLPALLTAAAKKEVGAVFSDGLKLSLWVSDPAAENCCNLLAGSYFSSGFLGEGLSIMVKKSDAKLSVAFDHALLNLERDGRLNDLYLRYFPNGLY